MVSPDLIPWPIGSEWISLLGSITTFHPMTNRKWVDTMTVPFLCWTHLCYSSCRVSVIKYFFQWVSSHCMINRMWVTHSFLYYVNSSSTASKWCWIFFPWAFSHPWLTEGEWYCIFVLVCTLITTHPMTNRKWVALYFFHSCDIPSHPMANRMWVNILLDSHISSNHNLD